MAPHSNYCKANQRHAFTLIELLVVTTILCLLTALLLPALKVAKNSGYSVQCANNLRQLGHLRLLWSADHNQLIVPYVQQYTWAQDYNAYLPPSLWPVGNATNPNQIKGIWRCELTLRGMDVVGTAWGAGGHGFNASYLVNSNLGGNPVNVPMVLQDNILNTATLGTYCDTISVGLYVWNNCNGGASGYPEQFFHQGKKEFLFLDGHVQALSVGESTNINTTCSRKDVFCVIQK